ncbi:MAG TPA: cytochrome P460 family protein [Kofleriaceae bacterium]|nr:cytochrome P460 family protein [Kofleriaceae bacterium]
MRCVAIIVVGAVAAGCSGDDGGDGRTPLFAADYATTYREVRDCRSSGDHDLQQIRVLADPAAYDVYMARTGTFPVGAVVLKEQFDFGDATCAEDPVQWTVMVKTAAGGDPLHLGWQWQRVDAARRVVTENDSRCFGCHAECGVEPDGFDGTCAVP